jgi:hypothetical protein
MFVLLSRLNYDDWTLITHISVFDFWRTKYFFKTFITSKESNKAYQTLTIKDLKCEYNSDLNKNNFFFVYLLCSNCNQMSMMTV